MTSTGPSRVIMSTLSTVQLPKENFDIFAPLTTPGFPDRAVKIKFGRTREISRRLKRSVSDEDLT